MKKGMSTYLFCKNWVTQNVSDPFEPTECTIKADMASDGKHSEKWS